jgi:hypothetical protein
MSHFLIDTGAHRVARSNKIRRNGKYEERWIEEEYQVAAI